MSDAPVAVVTGGAQGLGAAICNALLEEGYKVCIADINEETGRSFVEELRKEHGTEKVIFSRCDVTKESDYKSTFELTLKAFKSVDVLINNAGIVLEQNPRKVLDVNVMGPIIGCQTALMYMGKSNGGKGGIVINTASIVGFLPFSATPAYVASKHAVVGLTRSYGLPANLLKDGVIFAALCPSLVDTEILKGFGTNTLVQGLNVCDRPDIMRPDYVAQGVIKLLEDKINGSTLLVTKQKGYTYIGVQEQLTDIPLE